jgi:hypothetical protein
VTSVNDRCQLVTCQCVTSDQSFSVRRVDTLPTSKLQIFASHFANLQILLFDVDVTNFYDDGHMIGFEWVERCRTRGKRRRECSRVDREEGERLRELQNKVVTGTRDSPGLD